jgi:hypothetical protein
MTTNNGYPPKIESEKSNVNKKIARVIKKPKMLTDIELQQEIDNKIVEKNYKESFGGPKLKCDLKDYSKPPLTGSITTKANLSFCNDSPNGISTDTALFKPEPTDYITYFCRSEEHCKGCLADCKYSTHPLNKNSDSFENFNYKLLENARKPKWRIVQISESKFISQKRVRFLFWHYWDTFYSRETIEEVETFISTKMNEEKFKSIVVKEIF